MIKGSILFLVLVTILSCTGHSGKYKAGNTHSIIDSLLKAQQGMLTAKCIGSIRDVNLNGYTEKKAFKPDSLFWSHEFALFSALLVHPSELRANFSDSTYSQNSDLIHSYRRKEGSNSLESLSFCFTASGLPSFVKAEVESKAYSYQDNQMIELHFNHSGYLSNYSFQSVKTTKFGDSTIFHLQAKNLFDEVNAPVRR